MQAWLWLKKPTWFLDRCSAAYGDVFTMRLPFGMNMVHIASPELVKAVFGGDMPSTPPCYRGPWLQQNSWRTCRVWVWSFEAQAEGGSSRRSPAAERDEPP
jgi:cytochrome P450